MKYLIVFFTFIISTITFSLSADDKINLIYFSENYQHCKMQDSSIEIKKIGLGLKHTNDNNKYKKINKCSELKRGYNNEMWQEISVFDFCELYFEGTNKNKTTKYLVLTKYPECITSEIPFKLNEFTKEEFIKNKLISKKNYEENFANVISYVNKQREDYKDYIKNNLNFASSLKLVQSDFNGIKICFTNDIEFNELIKDFFKINNWYFYSKYSDDERYAHRNLLNKNCDLYPLKREDMADQLLKLDGYNGWERTINFYNVIHENGKFKKLSELDFTEKYERQYCNLRDEILMKDINTSLYKLESSILLKNSFKKEEVKKITSKFNNLMEKAKTRYSRCKQTSFFSNFKDEKFYMIEILNSKVLEEKNIAINQEEQLENKIIESESKRNNSINIQKTSTSFDKNSLRDELNFWKELYNDELITKAEYDAKRKELLESPISKTSSSSSQQVSNTLVKTSAQNKPNIDMSFKNKNYLYPKIDRKFNAWRTHKIINTCASDYSKVLEAMECAIDNIKATNRYKKGGRGNMDVFNLYINTLENIQTAIVNGNVTSAQARSTFLQANNLAISTISTRDAEDSAKAAANLAKSQQLLKQGQEMMKPGYNWLTGEAPKTNNNSSSGFGNNSSSGVGGVCFFRGEVVKGLNKVCMYNCTGSVHAITQERNSFCSRSVFK